MDSHELVQFSPFSGRRREGEEEEGGFEAGGRRDLSAGRERRRVKQPHNKLRVKSGSRKRGAKKQMWKETENQDELPDNWDLTILDCLCFVLRCKGTEGESFFVVSHRADTWAH